MALHQELPALEIQGETYPPTQLAQTLSNIVFFLRMLLIAAIFGGPGVLQYIGINQPPGWYQWTQDNKVTHLPTPPFSSPLLFPSPLLLIPFTPRHPPPPPSVCSYPASLFSWKSD